MLFFVVFASCSRGYENDGKFVYYSYWNEASGSTKVKLKANPKTFKILAFETYAKDDKQVFFKGDIITNADAKTFVALSENKGKDKNSAWYGNETIKGAKGSTFKLINNEFATDGYDVFYRKNALHIAKPKQFKFLLNVDDIQWSTDGIYYYINDGKVPSDDFKNFKIIGSDYALSKDSKWVYFETRKINFNHDGKKIIDTVDAVSFKIIKDNIGKDKFGCIDVFSGRIECP